MLSDYRRKKIGKAAIRFIKDKVRAYQLKTIILTVNKTIRILLEPMKN